MFDHDYYLQKNNTKLITWFLKIQSVSFTSAAFEAFVEAYLHFLVSALAKKNTEAIKFLEALKKMSPGINFFFV